MTGDCVTNLTGKGKTNLRVKQQLAWQKDRGWHITPRTKTDKIRKIPLLERWRQALIAQRAKDRRVNDPEWARDLIWVMPSGRYMNFKDYTKRRSDILDAYWSRHRSGDDKPKTADMFWRGHANRHLTASILFRIGVPLEHVQNRLIAVEGVAVARTVVAE